MLNVQQNVAEALRDVVEAEVLEASRDVVEAEA